MVTGCFGKLTFGRKTCEDRFLLFHGFISIRIQFSDPITERREWELILATPIYCILKIPTIAEGNPKSCMRIFPIIADVFGISLRPQ